MRPACKRTALRVPQANSAVNRGALAKDPRLEEVLAQKNEKDRAILDGGEAPTDRQRSARRKDKGGVKFALALSASGKKGMKVAADILQARKKAEAPDTLLEREESVNSAVDREVLLGDPRMERESFLRRRRSLDDGGGSSRSLYSSVSGSHRSLHSSIGGSHRSSPAERRNSEYSFREDFISTLLVEQAVERTSQLEEGESCAGSPDVTQSAPPRLGAVLSEMGFGKEQVEDAVEDLNRSGSKVDVDNILGALLGGSCRQVGSPSVGTTPGPDRSDIPDEKIPAKKTNRDTARASKPSKRDSHESDEELVCMEITPGQFAHLLKGRQTYDAVHNGTALSTACILCNTALKCTPDANYVLCPDCNVVSPLDGGGGKKNLRRNMINGCKSRAGRHVGFVGLGYTKSKT